MTRLIIPGLLLAFTVYCLIDVIRSEDSEIRGLPKLPWMFIVLLFPLAGGAAWFLAGRPRGTKPPGTDRITRPKPRVLGPDDDPDFLRNLDRPRPAPPVPGTTGSTGSTGTTGSTEGPDRPAGGTGGGSSAQSSDDVPGDGHDDTGEQDDRRS